MSSLMKSFRIDVNPVILHQDPSQLKTKSAQTSQEVGRAPIDFGASKTRRSLKKYRRRTACANCRRQKIKCVRNGGSECGNCQRLGKSCIMDLDQPSLMDGNCKPLPTPSEMSCAGTHDNTALTGLPELEYLDALNNGGHNFGSPGLVGSLATQTSLDTKTDDLTTRLLPSGVYQSSQPQHTWQDVKTGPPEYRQQHDHLTNSLPQIPELAKHTTFDQLNFTPEGDFLDTDGAPVHWSSNMGDMIESEPPPTGHVGDISTAALSGYLNATIGSAYDSLQHWDNNNNCDSGGGEISLYDEGSAKLATTPMSVLPTLATHATTDPIRDYWVQYYGL